MAAPDSLLKLLVSSFMTDVASWVLHTPVRAARPVNVVLPAPTLAVDQVLHVTLASGHEGLLHLEFQGRRSHDTMRWRMQEYISRLAHTYRLDLESVVVYIGRGAGREDSGVYHVNGLTGQPTLTWRYTVVRLWQLSAETLLAVGRPAVLALVGQTHIAHPEVVLPEVVRRLRQVPDAEQRGRLLTTLLALLENEEVITMVERLLTDDDVLLDLPYLRRLRAQEREEGRQEGRRQEAAEILLRQLQRRFGPLPEAVQSRVEAADRATLEQWSDRVVSAPTLEAVLQS